MQPPTLVINAQTRDLRDVLVRAFNLASLTQLVYFYLGQTLENLVNVKQAFEAVTFDLVRWAEQNGSTDVLVRAACEERPRNEHVRAYAARYGIPAASMPAALPRSIGSGLAALVDVASRPDGAVVRRVIREFDEEFEAARRSIEVMERYKALHDALHTVDFRLFGVISRSVLVF